MLWYLHKYNQTAFWQFLGFQLLFFVVVFWFLVMYKRVVTDRRPPFRGSAMLSRSRDGRYYTGSFSYKLLGCMEDVNTCFSAFFCPWARAADTYHAAGVMDYWATAAFYIGIFISFFNVIVPAIFDFLVYDIGIQADDCFHVSNCDEDKLNWESTKLEGRLAIGVALTAIPLMIIGGVMGPKRSMLRDKLGGKSYASLSGIDTLEVACCLCCSIAQEARSFDQAQGVQVRGCCSLMVGEPIYAQEFEMLEQQREQEENEMQTKLYMSQQLHDQECGDCGTCGVGCAGEPGPIVVPRGHFGQTARIM